MKFPGLPRVSSAAIAVLLSAGRAPAGTPCPPAALAIATTDRPAVATVVGQSVEAVAFTADRVVLGACSLPARVKGKRKRTIVTARGGPCGETKRLRLTARIGFPGCDTLTGVVRARGRGRAVFSAAEGTGATLITGDGGTAWSADGRVRLDFPPGAVLVPTVITITPATGLPGDERLVQGSTYTFEPAGLQFQQPVQLTINYGTLPPAQASTEQYLWLHKLVGGEWVEQPGTPSNPVAQTVSGTITGFSSYAVLLSQLATALQQAGTYLQVLLTNASAQNALSLLNSIAAIQQSTSLPAFQALAQPTLQLITSTACNAYATATRTALTAIVNDYQILTTVLDHLYSWLAIVQKVGATCTGVTPPDQVHTQKFGEFLAFYLARLAPTKLPTDFSQLLQEAQRVVTLRQDAQLLGLFDYDARLQTEAQYPLLDAMRAAAYAECRSVGEHKYLGELRQAAPAGLSSYSDAQVLDDLQYCGTSATWTTRKSDQAIVGNGTLGGGPNPGSITDHAAATAPSDGSLTWTNTFRAFKCPNGAYETDQLIFTLGGMEVQRLATAPSGNFLNASLMIDLAAALTTAGIDPVQNAGPHALEVARESPGCGQYLRTPNVPITLLTVDLTFQVPAGPSCPAPASWMTSGVDDRSNGVATVSLSHLSMTVSGTVQGTTSTFEEWSPEIHLNGEAYDYVKVIPVTPINPAIQLYARVSASGQASASISGRFTDGRAELNLYSGWLDNSLNVRAGESSPTGAMQQTQQISGVQKVGLGWSDRDWWEARMRITGFARHRGAGNSATVSGNLTISVQEIVDENDNQIPVLICSAGGINYGTGAPGSSPIRRGASFPTEQRTQIVPARASGVR